MYSTLHVMMTYQLSAVVKGRHLSSIIIRRHTSLLFRWTWNVGGWVGGGGWGWTAPFPSDPFSPGKAVNWAEVGGGGGRSRWRKPGGYVGMPHSLTFLNAYLTGVGRRGWGGGNVGFRNEGGPDIRSTDS
jgi:hypothetical protein